MNDDDKNDDDKTPIPTLKGRVSGFRNQIRMSLTLSALPLLTALSFPASAMCFSSGSVTHCMDEGRSSTYQQQGRTTYSQGYSASQGSTWAEVERRDRYGDRRVRRYVDGLPVPRYGYGDRRFDYGGSETWYVGP